MIGYGTDELPAFYSRSSGLPIDMRTIPPKVAAIWRAKRQMGLSGGLLVTVPVPAADEVPASEIELVIAQAVAEAAIGLTLYGGNTLPAGSHRRADRRKLAAPPIWHCSKTTQSALKLPWHCSRNTGYLLVPESLKAQETRCNRIKLHV